MSLHGLQGSTVSAGFQALPAGRPRVADTTAALPRSGAGNGTARPSADSRAEPETIRHAGEGSAAQEATPVLPQGDVLAAAQAAHLHGNQLALNLVCSVVCVLFALLWRAHPSPGGVMPWAALGCLATTLWLALRVAGIGLSGQSGQGGQRGVAGLHARRYLHMSTLACGVSGLMFGWGWLGVASQLPSDERLALLLANVVVLLWALQACSAYTPAFAAFAATSLVPAVLVTSGVVGDAPGEPATAAGLLVVGLLSMMFSIRFAREFAVALGLRNRVQRLLDEVTAKRDMALAATQAKSRFLASVSHDLRQPLHAMNLYLASVAGHFDKLSTAPGDGPSARAVRDGIRSLQDSTVYLNAMFESLLDISRLNEGSVRAEIRYTTLSRLLEQLKADYSRQAANQGLRFELRLPAQLQIMEVGTDPALLERLLRNLLVNALRYTRSGGVRLSVVAVGRSLDFRVVDTGPGIERSLRQRVFEEFFQVTSTVPTANRSRDVGPSGAARDSVYADTRRPASGGIGLGLSISTRLADKLGSRIRLHSVEGRGSVFAFRQPMRLALRPRVDTLPLATLAASGPLPAGLFLAVIDDDVEIRRSTRQMLEVLGVEVFTAASAEKAVQQLGRLGRVPDLVLSDYRLGAANGVQAIAMLRDEFNQDIPAILITGDTSPERRQEFQDSGLRVLYKPISGAQLLAAVEQELRAISPADP